MNRRVAPPSGAEPPRQAKRKDGAEVELEPIAREVCDRYFAEYPDDVDRYGEAGYAWCVHDTLYQFAWAIADHDWGADIKKEVRWLANVLEARDFPVDRLVRNLELAATVARVKLDVEMAQVLEGAATEVRLRSSGP